MMNFSHSVMESGFAFSRLHADDKAMRRVTGIAALLAVLGVGSGVLDYLHQANHQRQAAQWPKVVAKFSGQKASPLRSAPVEPANCPICFWLTFHTACESA